MNNSELLRRIIGDSGFDLSLDFEQSEDSAPADRSPPLLYTVKQAARVLQIGRSQMYTLIGEGEIRSLKLGRSRRIAATELDEYIARKMEDEEAG